MRTASLGPDLPEYRRVLAAQHCELALYSNRDIIFIHGVRLYLARPATFLHANLILRVKAKHVHHLGPALALTDQSNSIVARSILSLITFFTSVDMSVPLRRA